MEYEKPKITTAADAVAVVQGPKMGGPVEVAEPQNPIRSVPAYASDE